ncbi:MAG: hypothetical protein FWE61_07365, partial [Micrococcales bacterium]|nr:hypothetical protein [Micrococcales bacterium]
MDNRDHFGKKLSPMPKRKSESDFRFGGRASDPVARAFMWFVVLSTALIGALIIVGGIAASEGYAFALIATCFGVAAISLALFGFAVVL